jgi:C-terminal processing protease CtpA/Prc
VDDFGRIYYEPIGVLTDAGCYSSCDIFAAVFQDKNIGHVFGEVANTGGGGATVLTINENDSQVIPPNVLKIPKRF